MIRETIHIHSEQLIQVIQIKAKMIACNMVNEQYIIWQ